MSRLVVSEFLTLDGVFEDPGGEGFDRGGWAFQFPDEAGGKFKLDELFASDALLLGRVTYQGFAAAWPSRTDDVGFAAKMNSMPKFVVSTSLPELEWQNSTLIRENVVEKISRLKQQPGKDILVFGSGELVRLLIQNALVDEYRLMVYPILLGAGKRLFGEASETTALRLVDAKTFASGTVVLTYQPEKERGE